MEDDVSSTDNDTLFGHPCDPLDELLSALDGIPGCSVERGNGPGYSVKRLRSLYDHARGALPVKVGDHVRVNEGVDYGSTGLDVAGRSGVVRHIDWNSSWAYWQVVVEMQAGWTDMRGSVNLTRPKLFSFGVDSLTVVSDAEAGCGARNTSDA